MIAGAADTPDVERRERALNADEARAALAAMARVGLWQRVPAAYNPDVHDGASWVMEGRSGTGYHAAVTGGIAADDDLLRDVMIPLLELGGMDRGPLQRRGE